ncbi:MAG: CPBP family intramembrane metalloprotease [Bacilli bacterium]|nr:CPBP family intramembrane metalloprotease [Bacilli bacterium]
MKKINKFVLISIILMVIFSLTNLVKIEFEGEIIKLASLTLIIGIVAFFVTGKSNKNKELNIKTVPTLLKDKRVIMLVLMPVVMNILCFLIAKLFVPEFIEHLKVRTDFLTLNKVPILIVELIISALGEEIAWRGFFQKQVSKVISFLPSLIISAVLFSICHYTEGSLIVVLYDLLFIFINAIFYGAVFHKTDNAYVSTLAHFLANLLGTIAIIFL